MTKRNLKRRSREYNEALTEGGVKGTSLASTDINKSYLYLLTRIPKNDQEIEKRRWTCEGNILRMDCDASPKIALTWTSGRVRETWQRTTT